MTIVYYLALVLHLIACFFLIAVVLLQQGKGQDLASAFGGGGTQTAVGQRGSAHGLSRATTILAGVFMVTSLVLSTVHPKAKGLLDEVASPTPAATGAAPLPAPTASAAAATSPSPAAH
jgi:preprotein translocase subunit SecG